MKVNGRGNPARYLLSIMCIILSACTVEPDFGDPPDMSRFNETIVGSCERYDQSSIYRSRANTVIVYPQSDWIGAIENAASGTEILLEDGDYTLDAYAVRIRNSVTIRSVSANPARVRIRGMGYGAESEGFMVLANDVTIADLSISYIRNHAIAVNPQSGAGRGLQLYNLHLTDIGTQHIKVNPGGARDGLIACSTIGYSEGGARGDYNGAIDLHGTIAWTIRDNFIYNIYGDGSGCIIDQECGQYISSPAILAWNGARDTMVTGNTLENSFRNIAFGFGTIHSGGSILHNVVTQSSPGDAGIELFGATDTMVEYNTINLAGRYPGAVEFRQSSGLTIANNWLSERPWDRGGNSGTHLSRNSYRVSDSPYLQ